VDFDGYLRQGGRVLPVVMRAEQQFQGIGQQDPDVSPGAAAVTAIRRAALVLPIAMQGLVSTAVGRLAVAAKATDMGSE